jgi:hypothetical protein
MLHELQRPFARSATCPDGSQDFAVGPFIVRELAAKMVGKVQKNRLSCNYPSILLTIDLLPIDLTMQYAVGEAVDVVTILLHCRTKVDRGSTPAAANPNAPKRPIASKRNSGSSSRCARAGGKESCCREITRAEARRS